MVSHSTHRFGGPLFGVAVLLIGSACVSQGRYDEALEEVRYYQRALQDLEVFHGTCEASIARLEGELAIRAGEPIEAAMTAEIDARLAELDKLVQGIGTPGDVSLLAVDGGYGLRLSSALLFASGSDELTPDGRAILETMAKQIVDRPFERVWVRGHSDSDPIVRAETLRRFPQGNLQLSTSRALHVASLLADNGIPRQQLVVAGFGPSDPVAPNASADQKAQNRRVEIFVIEESPEREG